MSDEKTLLKKARDTGRTSPSFALADAIVMAEKLRAEIGANMASRDTLAQALGHSSFNGTVSVKAGTLSHYGLIEVAGKGCYQLSELARELLIPRHVQEKTNAIAKAAKTPSLYQELVERFHGQALPGLLANFLVVDFGVAQKKASEVDSIFRETMKYAGLLRNGILYSEPLQDASTCEPESRSVAPATADEVPSEPVAPSVGTNEYQILLPNKRQAFLRLPACVSAADLIKIEKWIHFNRDELVNEGAAVASGGPSSQGQVEPS